MASLSATTPLPLRAIPGDYGAPVLGPLRDRLDYFWFQGPDTFFRHRMQKHGSTVFRTNIPPTFPLFLNVNPNMIAVLDCMAFSALFDTSLVDKRDTLVGDYMPSTSFTGNLRVLAYLDTSEPRHAAIKSYAIDVLKSSSRAWQAELLRNLATMWDTIDADLAKGSSAASFLAPLQRCIFRFLTKSLLGADPLSRPLVDRFGFAVFDTWLALQLLPTVKVGVLQPLEELLLHSFPLPAFPVSLGYNWLYRFVEEEGKEVVEKGVREYGLEKEEAIHNLLFVLGFNAFGGFSVFLPTLLTTIGRDKTGLQERLRREVRVKGKEGIGFGTVAEMELVRSTVYEVLRLNPPVQLQYGRARKDFVLSSHDAAFEIKKGELLCGYQPLAMRDPSVFESAEEFVPDRFMAAKGGQALLDYLYWSNGPQTGTPSTSNKQCAAKDYVVATACVIVAWIFTRYDEFRCDDSSLAITKVVKASSGSGSLEMDKESAKAKVN